jgi:hypothetical protein
MDRTQKLGEFLGHVSGALAARTGDTPASCRDAALQLSFAEAEELLAQHAVKMAQPADAHANAPPESAAPAPAEPVGNSAAIAAETSAEETSDVSPTKSKRRQ